MLNSKRVRDRAISFLKKRYSVKPDPKGNALQKGRQAQKIIKKCMKNSGKVSSLSIQNILVECSTFFMDKGLLRLQRV